MGMGPVHSASLPHLPILMQLLLHVLSDGTLGSLQVVVNYGYSVV